MLGSACTSKHPKSHPTCFVYPYFEGSTARHMLGSASTSKCQTATAMNMFGNTGTSKHQNATVMNMFGNASTSKYQEPTALNTFGSASTSKDQKLTPRTFRSTRLAEGHSMLLSSLWCLSSTSLHRLMKFWVAVLYVFIQERFGVVGKSVLVSSLVE
jgi:hypothetical protein